MTCLVGGCHLLPGKSHHLGNWMLFSVLSHVHDRESTTSHGKDANENRMECTCLLMENSDLVGKDLIRRDRTTTATPPAESTVCAWLWGTAVGMLIPPFMYRYMICSDKPASEWWTHGVFCLSILSSHLSFLIVFVIIISKQRQKRCTSWIATFPLQSD